MINNWYLLFIKTEENFMKQIGSVNLVSGKRFYHSDIESYGINEDDLYYLGNDQEYHKLK